MRNDTLDLIEYLSVYYSYLINNDVPILTFIYNLQNL